MGWEHAIRGTALHASLNRGRARKCTRPSILVYSGGPAGARSAAGPGGGSEGDGSGAWSGRGAPSGGPRSEKAGRTSSLFAEVPPGGGPATAAAASLAAAVPLGPAAGAGGSSDDPACCSLTRQRAGTPSGGRAPSFRALLDERPT